MRKPTFLFLGPDKTGSTWLYGILRSHPQCYVPDIKDIYFFDRHYDRGLAWYCSFFEQAPADARAVGELSHDYLFSGDAASRIRADVPDAKLLTVLRNPVERTFSHYLYMVRSGRTRLPFEQALESFPELTRNSHYLVHLEPYRALFPGRQLGVFFFDDLRADAAAFAARIFAFLGVDFVEDLPYHERVLGASQARSRAVAHLMKSGANFARELGWLRLVGRVKSSPAVQRLLYRTYAPRSQPVLRPETAEGLGHLFYDETSALEAWTGRDLSAWKSSPAGSYGGRS